MEDVVKMTRLERLYQERDLIKKFKCIPFSVRESLIQTYNREINAIEIYHSDNRESEMPRLV